MKSSKNNDILSQRYNEYLDEYLAVLTKLTQMAFVLRADYQYILEERKKQQENRKENIEEGDGHGLVLHAIDFVYDVAVNFEKFNLHDEMISVEIKNWDNIGDELLTDIDVWMKYYIKEHLPENRKKEVKEFITTSNKYIANINKKIN